MNITDEIWDYATKIGLDWIATGGGCDFIATKDSCDKKLRDVVPIPYFAIKLSDPIDHCCSPEKLTDPATVDIILNEDWTSFVTVPFRNAKDAMDAMSKIYAESFE